MKKILALLLALLMVAGTLSLVACGGDKDPEEGKKEPAVDPVDPGTEPQPVDPSDPGTDPTDPGTDPVDPVDPADPDKPYLDNLGTYDFGGDVVMLMINGPDAYVIRDMDEYNDGDAVEVAVYTRQSEVEERFNIVFDWTDDKGMGEVAAALDTDVQSGTGEYDIVQGHMKFDASAALSGLCLNLNKLTPIDFKQNYWNHPYTDAWSFKTLSYWTTGDITKKYIENLVGIFVNADYFKTFFPDDDLFSIIFDGQWTVEKMLEYINNFEIDEDGDGLQAVDGSGRPLDSFGFVFENGWTQSSICYGAGFNLTTKSGSKYALSLQTPENEAIYGELLKFFTSNHVVRVGYDDPLKQKTCLFTVETIDCMEGWRDLEFEYYTIPLPKYSEELSYRTPHYDGVPQVGVDAAISAERYEEIGVIMEAMAAAGLKYTTPAYFETALQAKFSRNEGTMRCLSIIRETAWCDFGFAWCQPLSGLDTLPGDCAAGGLGSVSVMYSTYGPRFEKGIQDLYTKFNQLLKKD